MVQPVQTPKLMKREINFNSSYSQLEATITIRHQPETKPELDQCTCAITYAHMYDGSPQNQDLIFLFGEAKN